MKGAESKVKTKTSGRKEYQVTWGWESDIMKKDNLYSSEIIIFRGTQFRGVWWSCVWHPWRKCKVLTVFCSVNCWGGDHLWYLGAAVPYIMHSMCDGVSLSHVWVAVFIGFVWFVIESYLVFHGYDWASFMNDLTTWVCDRVSHTRLAWLQFVIELPPGFHGYVVSYVKAKVSVVMIKAFLQIES